MKKTKLLLIVAALFAMVAGKDRRYLQDSKTSQLLVTRKSNATGNLAQQLKDAGLEGLRILQEFRFGQLSTVLVELEGKKDESIEKLKDLPLVCCVHKNGPISGPNSITKRVEKKTTTRMQSLKTGRPWSSTYGQNTVSNRRRRATRLAMGCCRDGFSHLPPNTSPSDVWALQRISAEDRPSGRKGLYWEDAYQMPDGFWEGGLGAGQGVDIYVLDSGINVRHPEFLDGSAPRAFHGFTASRFRDIEGHSDFAGHGTHVASIAMGGNIGVARQATAIAVKVLDQYNIGDEATAIEGLQWVFDQVQEKRKNGTNPKIIINMSLGLSRERFPERCATLDSVIDEMVAAGFHIVVAAGNSNTDACSYCPAGHPGVVTVGASNPDDRIWHYSNYGSCVDVLAPGEFVYGAATAGHSSGPDDLYVRVDGTSHATPLVTGVLAGYLSLLPADTSPQQLKALLIRHSTEGKISGLTRMKRETPNRLLFYECFEAQPFHPAHQAG